MDLGSGKGKGGKVVDEMLVCREHQRRGGPPWGGGKESNQASSCEKYSSRGKVNGRDERKEGCRIKPGGLSLFVV